MSSAIIATPPFARTIDSLSLIDPMSHKSIRVPCRTPENGLEALEMREVFEGLDQQMQRIEVNEEQWAVVQDILSRYDITGFGDRLGEVEQKVSWHDREVSDAKTLNEHQDNEIATLKQKVAVLEELLEYTHVDNSGLLERLEALENLVTKHTQDIANLVTDLRVTNGDQDMKARELRNFVDIFYANQTNYNDHVLNRLKAIGA